MDDKKKNAIELNSILIKKKERSINYLEDVQYTQNLIKCIENMQKELST
jgi:hypothetical protein